MDKTTHKVKAGDIPLDFKGVFIRDGYPVQVKRVDTGREGFMVFRCNGGSRTENFDLVTKNDYELEVEES